uniref:Glycosyltransferase family 25 n=1 Tax=Marseillevirus LCMAC103 TaxID=2506604 RepID=A0A481YUX5_9VIRU|nr:MAG: glycosyltransferase family 25 [Marseillevirus LCMAC103]
MDVSPFDAVFVVALPERRESVTSVLAAAGIRPTVFPAILRGELDLGALVAGGVLTEDAKISLNTGQIACHLSHVSVLAQFLRDPAAQTCLVFEDDLRPVPGDTVDEMRKIRDAVPPDWDILYLGRCSDLCCHDVEAAAGVVRCTAPFCRHAYAVTRRGAATIVANTLPMDRLPGDKMYANLIRDGALRAYCAKPALFFQDREAFASTLGNTERELSECSRFQIFLQHSDKTAAVLCVLVVVLAAGVALWARPKAR